MTIHHVTLMHGIFEGLTSPGWPWGFPGWLRSQGLACHVHVETEHYKAGILTPRQHLWTNPRMARAMVERQAAYRDALSPVDRQNLLFHIAGHSNAAQIKHHMLALAPEYGLRYETASFVAGALHADPEKSSVAEALESRTLGRAIAWASPDDGVIAPLQRPWKGWGYGSVGARGWEKDAWRGRDRKAIGLRLDKHEPLSDLDARQWGASKYRLVTRWFPGFGHSRYWKAGADRLASYQCFAEDMGLI